MLKLKVGGKYRDGRGDTIEICRVGLSPTYPFICNNSRTFRGDGTYDINTPSALDLIEEITTDGPKSEFFIVIRPSISESYNIKKCTEGNLRTLLDDIESLGEDIISIIKGVEVIVETKLVIKEKG